MVSAHRQAWTWQDEWYGLTMTQIRKLEAETAEALALKMGQSEGGNLNITPSSSGSASATVVDPQQDQQLGQVSFDNSFFFNCLYHIGQQHEVAP